VFGGREEMPSECSAPLAKSVLTLNFFFHFDFLLARRLAKFPKFLAAQYKILKKKKVSSNREKELRPCWGVYRERSAGPATSNNQNEHSIKSYNLL